LAAKIYGGRANTAFPFWRMLRFVEDVNNHNLITKPASPGAIVVLTDLFQICFKPRGLKFLDTLCFKAPDLKCSQP